MGLLGRTWLKKLLREHPQLRDCMHYASWSKMRRNERPSDQKRVGKGVEPGFQVVLVELMLHKYVMIKGCQGLEHFAKRWRDLAEEQIKRFPDAHTFVFLLDDETNVPQAKSQTQSKRRRGSAGLSADELEALGPHFSRLCNSDPVQFNRRIGELFGAQAAERKMSPFEVFMTKHMLTSQLREDEFEFATRCILAGPYAKLGTGRRVIIDRGIWRPSFHRDIETDPTGGESEPWTRVLKSFRDNISTANLLDEAAVSNAPSRAWILMDRWGVRRLDDMEDQHLVGEADLKIPRYARVFASQRIYVICNDTDLIPILLLAVKDWVPPKGRCPGQLWLDMTTHYDEKPEVANCGVIDMIQLWRNVHRWFATEFSEVLNPVEVWCTLMAMMGTDYLKNPAALGEKRLWSAFSKHFKVRKSLAEAVWTDGHISAALPPDPKTGRLLTRGYYAKTQSLQDGSCRTVKLLLRDTTAGSIYDPKTQRKPGLANCAKHHRVRHISLREDNLMQFVLRAYAAEGPKDASKWPDREWMRGFARRVGWQVGYWYIGDTRCGRQWYDEMAQTADGRSIHGWRWGEDAEAVNEPETAKILAPSGRTIGRKRKAGCLGRRRPHRMVSEPALRVVQYSEFRRYQKSLATVLVAPRENQTKLN